MSYLSLHSNIVHVSVVLGVVSQPSKMWRNDRNLVANRKHLNDIIGSVCIRPKCDLRFLKAVVSLCVNGVAGIEIFVRTYCICPK